MARKTKRAPGHAKRQIIAAVRAAIGLAPRPASGRRDPADRIQALAPVAQWIEYWPPKPGVAGSIPAGRTRPIALKIILVKVKPNARASTLLAQDDGSWLAQIAAPPVDGQANEALIALVARQFGVRRAQVHVKTGSSGRLKRVQIET